MDGASRVPAPPSYAELRSASVSADDPSAISTLAHQIGDGPFSLIVLYCSPATDFRRLVAEASSRFEGSRIVACTTAGEITQDGYSEDMIVMIGLPRASFAVAPVLVSDLDTLDGDALVGEMILTRSELQSTNDHLPHEFAFLLVDGLSLNEDKLVSCLPPGLGHVPLFGGSAGDGIRFGETLLALDSTVYQNAAILVFVRSICPVRVFSLDHFSPAGVRMVVTRADPANRIVSQINAEPAAFEYARLVGKDPEQLSPFIFAAHPVVVRLGGRHHVRSIQRVTDSGELVFFSAIDEGVVLTVAESKNMATHLAEALDGLSEPVAPAAIMACDCILRRLEAGEKQLTGELSRVMSERNVIGFSTYGEQYAGMHVNQTMTGVAIYPPGTEVET